MKSFEDDMSRGFRYSWRRVRYKQEEIGSEDEENNYYSIGGDNHNDLEEDKG
jgi:hypothetical protein